MPTWIGTLSETSGPAASSGASQQEVTCLALAIYYESRGESTQGQRAVASVVMNRVRDSRFPDTICEVLVQRKQFSFMNDGRVLKPTDIGSWNKALDIAVEFANRPTTENKYLFFSGEGYLKGHRIGAHIFR